MSKKGPLEGLLRWYDANKRSLPWRENVSPYRTWVSEIMLQQTQVATVVPYFERFMKRFPTLEKLAASPQDEVLKHWAGLGYYSRARNLHAAAGKVVSEHGGRLPDTAEGLMELPGIGRYTAGAIASIAFDRPSALVDGNVIRVFARFFAIRSDVKSAATQRELWTRAEEVLDPRRPGDWNQALMELGARVCLPPPESPLCGKCPLAPGCEAFRRNLQHALPKAEAQKAPVPLDWTVLHILSNGKLLLWRRGPKERFLPGHWGLPEARHLRRAKAGRLLRTVRHSITHHRITLSVREGALARAPLPPQARWVGEDRLKNFLVSSLWTKALAR